MKYQYVFAIGTQFVKLILRLEFQGKKKLKKLLLFTPPLITYCQNVAKDIFCKDKLKVKLWAQLNSKLDKLGKKHFFVNSEILERHIWQKKTRKLRQI